MSHGDRPIAPSPRLHLLVARRAPRMRTMLRAEALWPKEDCWRGGGVFLGPQRLWLNLAPDARPRPGEKEPRELGLQIEQWPASPIMR